MSNTLPYAYFQNKFVKTEEARVSIMTNSLQYGNAFFSGIRGYYHPEKNFLSVFRMQDHYHRFLNSAKVMGVTLPYTSRELEKITVELAKKNNPATDVYFRPFAYAQSYNLSPNLAGDGEFAFALYMLPLGEYLSLSKGLSVCISSWRRVSDNAIPARAKISGSYVNSSLAHQEAERNGFDEAIMLMENGEVAEGSAANLFIVRDGVLVTPGRNNDLLEGITRRTILELARDLNIPTEERSVDRSELYVAEEAFFSGTGVQLSWISRIDHRWIGNGKRGPITEKIQDLYFQTVRGETKQYAHWCTKIKTQEPLPENE